MDLDSVKLDPVKIEKGAWVENIPGLGDIRLKVRGYNNSDWRRIQRERTLAVPRSKWVNGRITTAEEDHIEAICLRDAGILDWENVTQGGAPVPYSKDAAEKFLTEPKLRAFRDGSLWACHTVGDLDAESVETDAKNSLAP